MVPSTRSIRIRSGGGRKARRACLYDPVERRELALAALALRSLAALPICLATSREPATRLLLEMFGKRPMRVPRAGRPHDGEVITRTNAY